MLRHDLADDKLPPQWVDDTDQDKLDIELENW